MDDKKKLHIVVFPWLAFGHMIPFLELSKEIAKRGHHIYFISTSRNIQRLRSQVPDNISHSIQFTALQLPKVSGLPPDAESTFDIPQSKVDYLKIAFDCLQHPFTKLIKDFNPKPDYILQDFAQHWIPPIAAEAGVPTIFFNTFSISSLLFIGPLNSETPQRNAPEQFTVPPPWIPFPSNLCYRLHEARRFFSDSFASNKSGIIDTVRYKLVFAGCSAVAGRGCMELESDCFKVFPQVCGRPVLPVGLLLPAQTVVGYEAEIIQWLNQKRTRSVLYISFGSEAALGSELLTEIALGIEQARVPFIWACKEELPEGFEERTKEYGFVAKGWIRQVDVLGHGSIGGVLMHAGWGSVCESIHFGLPLALITIFADQGINARVVVQNGLGIEVERDESDGSFTKEDVAKAIRFVMLDDEGEGIREKAREMKQVFSDVESQNVYVDNFVEFLQSAPISAFKQTPALYSSSFQPATATSFFVHPDPLAKSSRIDSPPLS